MRIPLVTVLASLILTAAAWAQPTSFTYQGRLKNGATVATGLHDLRFRLFDAASGGTQVGTTQCVDNVQVTNGLFTATIDFGQQFATPNQRFLEIEVRADTGLDCSNSAGFTLLTPRQPITATPLADHAKSAYALDAADGSPAGAVLVDSSGKVGIGTTTPGHSLTIANPAPTIALQDTGSQQAGYVSYRDSGNAETAWVGYGTEGDPDFSIVNARAGGDIVLNPLNGNVGVGTATPAARLEVRGDIRLGPTGQLRAPGGEENLRIVRGKVSSNGQVLQGSGFSSSFNASTTTYIIVFDTPFSAPPVIVVTPDQGGLFDICAQIVLNTLTADSVRIAIFQRSDGRYDISDFHFMAIGPR